GAISGAGRKALCVRAPAPRQSVELGDLPRRSYGRRTGAADVQRQFRWLSVDLARWNEDAGCPFRRPGIYVGALHLRDGYLLVELGAEAIGGVPSLAAGVRPSWAVPAYGVQDSGQESFALRIPKCSVH